VRRPLLLTLACAGLAAAAPGRHIRYAESANRLVYAFVFGSSDTCRVIRRPAPPRDDLRRRVGADWRGLPGESIVAEFRFGRSGRPVHIVPTNDGKYVVAFANRAPDGSAPTQDRVHHLGESNYAPVLDYAKLPADVRPAWPELPRALPRKPRPEPPPPVGLTYAFVTDQPGDDRLIVARWTEGSDGPVGEVACFAVALPGGEVTLPDAATLARLASHEEPLFRAGAAWALGHGGQAASTGTLRRILSHAQTGVEQAEAARALARCGDEGGRRTLRALLGGDDAGGRRAAAAALLTLAPERGDGEALAGAIADADPDTAGDARLALARLGAAGLSALVRVSRSSHPAKRAAAAAVLGRIDDAAAEKRLLTLVLDSDGGVQKAAAVALTSPPRAILPEHHTDYARALDACRRSRAKRASFLLSVLAAQARIRHEKVLEALVGLADFQDKAIWALAKLTKQKLETAEDCKRWWKGRK
jgi:HEAT repeat protein